MTVYGSPTQNTKETDTLTHTPHTLLCPLEAQFQAKRNQQKTKHTKVTEVWNRSNINIWREMMDIVEGRNETELPWSL